VRCHETSAGSHWVKLGVLIAKIADAPRMARETKGATVMSVENIFLCYLYKKRGGVFV